MASGKKTGFSGSLSVKDSDFLFYFTCTPCTKEGLNNEAINYCVDCSEYFCGACTKQHKKFGGTSDHNVVNRTVTQKSAGVPPSPVVRETCREHHGERLTTYCADHDLVVCNTCVSVDHRLCDGISYIPKVASGAKQSKQINKVKKQISESLQTNDKTKIALQQCLASADQEKKDQYQRIHDYIERLFKHARNLETAAIRDVDNHHKNITETLQADIRSLDEASTILKTRLTSLSNAKTNSEAQVFVDCKSGAHEIRNVRELQQEMERSVAGKATSAFVIRDEVDSFLTKVHSIGRFVENGVFSVELLGKYNVDMPKEKYTCIISDICELSDGNILISDGSNESLKRLDTLSYKVTDFIATPSMPSCICNINDDEVAVTLTHEKKVQFVSVSGPLQLTRWFKVGDHCRGVVFSRGELFVLCGGFPGKDNFEPDDGPGHIEIYAKTGTLLRTIQSDSQGGPLFSYPRRITTLVNGTKLAISESELGIITVDREGNLCSAFSSDVLQGAFGISTVKRDNVVVCGYLSNNVVQINTRGEIVTQLLTGEDGIKKPTSIRSIRDNSRLIITEDYSDTIKIYSLWY